MTTKRQRLVVSHSDVTGLYLVTEHVAVIVIQRGRQHRGSTTGDGVGLWS